MRTILHIDFNSYFATVEQQANPRLRGKPIGVTGGDRMKRTVLGAASVEAKKFGVKTGMQIWEAKKLCPNIILVSGDSDKYLECTKRFLTILKAYSPYLEVFSIDEVFMETYEIWDPAPSVIPAKAGIHTNHLWIPDQVRDDNIKTTCDFANAYLIAQQIKSRIRSEIGEWITCSIGISYNKLMAKLAGSLQKPDGLVVIANPEETVKILDEIALDEICGIGGRIKVRLNKMGIFHFKQLRQVPLEILTFQFKSYGNFLYNAARGIDESPIIPFYEKEEIQSVSHRHTIDHDTDDLREIKQILLKLTELIARRARAKKLVGKTVNCWFRYGLHPRGEYQVTFSVHPGGVFTGNGMQITIQYTNDGLEIFQAAWRSFQSMWNGSKIRMIGVSISNLKPQTPQNLSFLDEVKQKEVIIKALDKINDKYGEFTLKRAILLGTPIIRRTPNPFLTDRRFKV
ncbi:hypothetical protein A3B39_05095 [Candidatus Daviesbacteria bacterium RIFCSPLOWO2_01_FULL_37_10]|nr:MAG: hypothetical protein A3B39_05095 [Candidatus Daviesbacteria bacterium RIFCSPLOWO2_01_FULL_37_10]